VGIDRGRYFKLTYYLSSLLSLTRPFDQTSLRITWLNVGLSRKIIKMNTTSNPETGNKSLKQVLRFYTEEKRRL